MPKMAKNGPKWPKFGPNTCNFDIFKLEMSQNYVESHTDCPETIFQKSKMFNLPKMVQNGQNKALHLIFWVILGMLQTLDVGEILIGETVLF